MKFLRNQHSFAELQLSSCYKLIHIFSPYINLFIGDAKELPSLPGVAAIWVYLESMKGWVPLTKTVKKIMYPNLPHSKTPISPEKFVNQLQSTINDLNKAFEMQTEQHAKWHSMINYNSDTRLYFLKLCNGHINETHSDDPHITTPPSVVSDLLACVDDLDKKQIRPSNAEIVERLIHSGKKSDPKNITFGVDDRDKMRAAFCKKVCGVESVIFPDKDPKHIVQALGKKQWDVALINSSV